MMIEKENVEPSDVNNLREKVQMLLQVNTQKRDFCAVFLFLL